MTSPSETLSPEDQLARIRENKIVCEKLLGWRKCSQDSKGARNGFDWEENEDTPDFSSWGQTGLILDALQKLSYDKRAAADVLITLGDLLVGARLTPAFIRAAALDYIKQSMGWHTYLKAVKS